MRQTAFSVNFADIFAKLLAISFGIVFIFFPKNEKWFEPMFFYGFFCRFESCSSVIFLMFFDEVLENAFGLIQEHGAIIQQAKVCCMMVLREP
jgi:hypothetical protein